MFVEDDTALADKLGPLGKASKRDGGGNTIQFSAEADGELLPDGKIRMGKPHAGEVRGRWIRTPAMHGPARGHAARATGNPRSAH